VKSTKQNVPNTLTQPLFLNRTRNLAHLLKNPISAHTLFKKPYQEEFTTTLLQEKKYEMNTPIEDAEICLKPVEQIAQTIAAPLTKL